MWVPDNDTKTSAEMLIIEVRYNIIIFNMRGLEL